MNDQHRDDGEPPSHEQATVDATAPTRKPWVTPTLTVRSIEDVTHGTRSSVRLDGRFFFS